MSLRSTITGLSPWRKVYSIVVVSGYVLAILVAVFYETTRDRSIGLHGIPAWSILLGPFAWVFFNPRNSWVVPAIIGSVPWAIALQTRFPGLSIVFIVLAPIAWLFLGIMGSSLLL